MSGQQPSLFDEDGQGPPRAVQGRPRRPKAATAPHSTPAADPGGWSWESWEPIWREVARRRREQPDGPIRWDAP